MKVSPLLFLFVKVFDGPDSSASSLGQLCRSSISSLSTAERTFQSSGNTLFLLFKSDGSVTQSGFKAVFTVDLSDVSSNETVSVITGIYNEAWFLVLFIDRWFVSSNHLLTLLIADLVMVAKHGGQTAYADAIAEMQSPLLDLDTAHCLSFRYFIRSQLTVLKREKSEATGSLLFEVQSKAL